jgi:hypothetical protein
MTVHRRETVHKPAVKTGIEPDDIIAGQGRF